MVDEPAKIHLRSAFRSESRHALSRSEGSAVPQNPRRKGPTRLEFTGLLCGIIGTLEIFYKEKCSIFCKNYLSFSRKFSKSSHFLQKKHFFNFQWMITAHIASKLHLCLEFLMKNPDPSIRPPTSIVVAGGVASNSFIFNGKITDLL